MRTAPADRRPLPEPEAIRRVRTAALDVLADTPGEPCQDAEGCLTIVYMAGVADALSWATGDGPLPRSVRERGL